MHLRRYLVLKGETDTWVCPEWYPLMQAARYLHMTPMALSQESIWWRDKALIAMSAEAQAQEILNKQP